MLVEFTNYQNKPVFINPIEVEAIEEKHKTIIYLKSGIKFSVQETAGTVYREINDKLNETIMENMLNESV